MSNRSEKAKELFMGGFNCAQSVFLSFNDVHGIDNDTAARLVCTMGGGISKTRNICGALSGACLAMSAKCGKKDPSEPEKQAKTYENAQNIIKEFVQEFGSSACPALLGYDISDPRQFDEAAKIDAFHTVCPKYVEKAAELASKYVD